MKDFYQGADLMFVIDFESSEMPDIVGFDAFTDINIKAYTKQNCTPVEITFADLEITPLQIKGTIPSEDTLKLYGELFFAIEFIQDPSTLTPDAVLNLRQIVATNLNIKQYK